MNTKTSLHVAIALAAILCISKASGQDNIGQWDFNNGDLSATSGSDLGPLNYYDGSNGTTSNLTQFGTTTTLGVPNIGGQVASIMRFPGNTSLGNGIGYLMPTPPANGGGSLVNDYTVIVDVLYTNSGLFRPILQMDDGALDHILAFFDINLFDQVEVTNTQGAGLPSLAFGYVAPNTWYRIGFVLDHDIGQIDVYTNGYQAGSVFIGTGDDNLDGPYALYSGFLPLFSSTATNVEGFVNSVQLRDTPLNAGQMAALGGPSAGGIPIIIPAVKTFVQSQVPFVGDKNVLPQPNFNIVLNQGDTVVDPRSIQVFLDGAVVPSSVVSTPPTYTITASETNLMAPGSLHTATVSWSDSVAGPGSNSWTFTVFDYQVINLPTPFYLETFDEVNITTNGALPAGWYATNETTVQGTNYDLCEPVSATYENWLVDDTNFICGGGGGPCSGFEADTTNQPPIVLNGSLIYSLASNNILYFESDNRCSGGCFGQAGFVFTPDIDCSGQSNVYVCFNSLWMQNRNSFGSLEYSTNQGVSWLPALYCITSSDGANYSTMPGGGGSRIIYTNNVIDVTATFDTPYSDQAGYPTMAFEEDAHWKLAPVSTADIPFIQGFVDDGVNYTTTGGGVTHSQWMGKEIEEIRIAGADFQGKVRFRFGYTGRCSWYWGIDNFGLYSINSPAISTQPQSLTVDDQASASFSVIASGATPLNYQWRFDGTNLSGATNSTLSIANVTSNNVGTYTVIVGNTYGSITSDPATLSIYTTPVITAGPVGEIADPGATVTFTATANGALPLTYIWLYGETVLQSSTSSSLAINNVQAANAGSYYVAVSNSFGAVTSSPAILKVYSGPITSNLVVHLTFDGNFNDTSGAGNNAAYATNGPNSNPNPTFVPGKIGQAFEYTTTADASIQEYATLGYPADLQLGSLTDFSFSAWVNYTNQQDDLPFICNKDWNSSSDVGWGVFTQSGGNYRVNVTGPNQGADKYSETDTPTDLKDGNWHNVLVSFQRAPYGSSAFVYGYLDGVLVSKHSMGTVGDIDTITLDFTNEQGPNSYLSGLTGELPDNQTSWAVNIGQDGTGVYHDQGNAHDINAKIDDVGFWLRALTANEAKAVYVAGQAGQDLTMALSAQLTATVSGSGSGATLNLTWPGSSNLELQTSPSLSPATWTVVSGSLGASSASIPIHSTTAGFFRLVQLP